MKALLFLVALAVCFGTFYKVWRQPDDFVEQMWAVYEDPGDLNRWLAEKGVLKWFFRLIVTTMFLAMVYIGLKYIAWLW